MFPGAAKEARIYPAFEGEHCLQSASSKKRHKVWFAQSWDGYRVNTTDKCNNGRLDTHIIAREIHYACRHTPHLKHCLQQESIAACQPRLMRSLSKTGKTFERERLTKKPSEHKDVAEFHTFFPPSVPRSSQMLCLARIMICFSHEEIDFTATSPCPGLLSTRQACVCVWNVSESETEECWHDQIEYHSSSTQRKLSHFLSPLIRLCHSWLGIKMNEPLF